MPIAARHLTQARAFKADCDSQAVTAYAVRVMTLHLTGLHLVDTRLAQQTPPIHPSSHTLRNELLRTRPSSFHGVPRKAVDAYLALLEASHEVRYECPPAFRLEQLHQMALEEYSEVIEQLSSTGIQL